MDLQFSILHNVTKIYSQHFGRFFTENMIQMFKSSWDEVKFINQSIAGFLTKEGTISIYTGFTIWTHFWYCFNKKIKILFGQIALRNLCRFKAISIIILDTHQLIYQLIEYLVPREFQEWPGVPRWPIVKWVLSKWDNCSYFLELSSSITRGCRINVIVTRWVPQWETTNKHSVQI